MAKRKKKKSLYISLKETADETVDAVKNVLPGGLINKVNKKIKLTKD